MSAKIIDGKAFAASLSRRMGPAITAFQSATGRVPGLAVVLVGDDPASEIYVRNKGRKAVELGMESFQHILPANTTQDHLLDLVAELNANEAVDDILVQLPLPREIDELAVIAALDPGKDVDGLHVVSAGRLMAGCPGMTSCTPLGCLMLLKDQIGDLSGLDAIVIGRSILVGKPMAQLLLGANCTVTIAHSRTRTLADKVRQADIVVAAAGQAELIKGDWIKPGATVIDVGINRVTVGASKKSRIVGDVAYAEAVTVAGAITPVPGGVGPMTIACLLLNTLSAACMQNGLPAPSF